MARVVTSVLLVLACALAWPVAAQAEAWSTTPGACGGIGRERGSGQLDARGWMYVACSKAPGDDGRLVTYPNVQVYDPAGTLQRIVPLDFDGDGTLEMREPASAYGGRDLASDVAPSPDGSALYVVRYDTRTVHRMLRRSDGTYAMDPGWRLADYVVGSAWQPRGEFVATDAAGDIYMTMGLWVPGWPVTIVKYRPDGSRVTQFGRQVEGSWALGETHDNFTGIAVTADGSRVFVGDKLGSRVHRFDRQASGTYAAVLTMGNTAANDPARIGRCVEPGVLAAPYDVSLAPSGEVVVVNTSCYSHGDIPDPATGGTFPEGTIEVQRFSQDGGSRGVVHVGVATGRKVHGSSIDRLGRLHLAQGGIVVMGPAGAGVAGVPVGGDLQPLGGSAAVVGVSRSGPVPGAPDTVAPVITSAKAPVETDDPHLVLELAASDVGGVTSVRVREDGHQFAWRPWATSLPHTIDPVLGVHELVVEVRDGTGNVSRGVLMRVNLVAPVAPASPGPATDRNRPSITAVVVASRVASGRRVPVRIRAADDHRVAQVRFATERGRWGRWQSITRARVIRLEPGAGFHALFVQVRDASGNRSRPWLRTILVAPRSAHWRRGTGRADRIRGTTRVDHVDLSSYDRRVDRISCGRGVDTVLLQPEDRAARDCERVVRIHTPGW